MNRLSAWLFIFLPAASGLLVAGLFLMLDSRSETDIRANQQASLTIAASSLAVLLAADAHWQDDTVLNRSARYSAGQLRGPITLDGRIDDWGEAEPRDFAIEDLLEIHFPYTLDDLRYSLAVGSDQKNLYLHFTVHDDLVVYRRVGGLSVHRNDHVQLAFVDATGRFQKLTIAVFQPGEVIAMHVSDSGRALRRFESLTGRWMATQAGYNLELKIPQAVLSGTLSAVVVDVDDSATRDIKFVMGASHTRSDERLGELVYLPTLFERRLNELAYEARVTDIGGDSTETSGFNSLSVDQTAIEATVAIVGDSGQLGTLQLRQSVAPASMLSTILKLHYFLWLLVALLIVALISGWLVYLNSRKNQQSEQRMLTLLGGINGQAGSLLAEQKDIADDALTANIVRLKQHNDYLERMASRLNHELRTPVSVVKSSLENLQTQTLDESVQVYVDRASQGVARLTNILNKMAEARRLEEALDEDEVTRFDLGELVRGCVAGYTTAFPDVTFNLSVEADEVPITGIPELMAQLLDKLTDNAVEFSSTQRVKLRVTVEQDVAIVRIMNEGPLLPAGNNDLILFESMMSVRQEQSAEGSHLGLGLYIARVIADFHGGQLTIANREDVQGVTVTMSVPLLRLTAKLR